MTDAGSESACRDLVVRGFRALDDRDYEALAACFAPGGVWERAGERLAGPDAVLAAMEKRPADLETQHLALNMVVEPDGADAATVRYTILAYAQTKGAPYHLHAMFRAVDRLSLTASGWRLTHRQASPAFSVTA